MGGTLYCLVDGSGKVYVKDGAESHADVAASFGLNEAECQLYRFDLTDRRLLSDRATPAGTAAVRAYLDQRIGAPDCLMRFALDGHLSKSALASLLDANARGPYLHACGDIERKYTEACAATNDPCLEPGCSIDRAAGEVCLQPILRAGVEYYKACAEEWARVFRSADNRIDAWRN
jgi:hypothetical protein